MPETIGHYEVLARLGRGSVGKMVRARDSKVGRTVAITLVDAKLLAGLDDRAAFLADARRVTALSHPNIAALYAIGEDADRLYLVWEFVAGSSLRTYMGDRPLNPARAIGIAVQVADALADGHARGIVHGDINPDTVMVTPTGRVKVLDFGLSHWTPGGRARAGAGGTGDGRLVSSLAYMSPEQALGASVDGRTDVFSLASVLYEMLTGEPPFAQPGQEPVPVQVLHRVPPPPSSVNPRVPPEVDEVLARALLKNPTEREGDAAALSTALKAIAIEQEAIAPEPAPQPTARTGRRSRAGLWLLLLLLALLLVAGWYWGDAVMTLWRRAAEPLAAPPVEVILRLESRTVA